MTVFNRHNKNWLVFFEINIFNLPIVFFVNFFKPVAYWKSSKIPKSFLYFFHLLEPEKIFKSGQMEWNFISSDAYDKFSSILKNHSWKDFDVIERFDNLTVDFTSVALAEMAEDFEAYYQFTYMVDEWQKSNSEVSNVTIVENVYKNTMKGMGECHRKIKINKVFNIFTFMDKINFLSENLFILIKPIIKSFFYYRKTKAINKKAFRILWKDISVNEITNNLLECNFAFLAHHISVDIGKILYVLPVEPSYEVCKWLESKDINWIVDGKYMHLIPYSIRWNMVRDIVFTFIRTGIFIGSSVIRRKIPSYIAKGAPLYCIAKTYGIDTIIGTTSGLSSCGPLNAIAKSSNIRTIIWQYSQAGVIPVKKSNLQGVTDRKRLVQSIFLCDEQWAWYHEDIKLYRDRCLQPPEYAPVFRVTGPIMPGNSDWIFKSPIKAREDMQLLECSNKDLLWLGVFDMDTKHANLISGIRSGPNRFTLEMQKAFFSHLCEAINTFPNLRIIYKPKRRVAAEKFVISNEMLELINPDGKYVKGGKVILTKYNIDPYIPIAMADCCIGAPYTSGVLLSNLVHRPGAYYDPLNMYDNCYPLEYKKLQISEKKSLFEKIERWTDDKSIVDSRVINNESVDKDFVKIFVKLLGLRL
ncbi:hypothetical protein OAK82_02300 [Candidatus Thioglobus sp.]|nr:hypothetical protein [Candidatus Thioglobus sp.]